eukprot:361921-Chlamydomonas_euryale.AAC.9
MHCRRAVCSCTQGIAPFIKALQARGTKVYLISGGFRELMLPISRYLGVPPENIFANRMLWQWDDETQSPSKLVGFDTSEPTSRNQGKPEAIATIRNKFPYNTVSRWVGASVGTCGSSMHQETAVRLEQRQVA